MVREMCAENIKLFWWRDKPNFGDALSAGVVEHLLKKPVVWSSEEACDIFAIGSILHRANTRPPSEIKPLVWGTGYMKYVSPNAGDRLEFLAVRGPITASYLNIDVVQWGDPGLFAGDLLEERPAKKWQLGIIPHYSQNNLFSKNFAESNDAVTVIDARTSDYMSVLRVISRCEYILSSSLHGLIVADSIGIPNRWINPFGISDAAKLKFYDYALSIGRDLGAPIPVSEVSELLRQDPSRYIGVIEYNDSIEKLKQGLRQSLLSSRLAN